MMLGALTPMGEVPVSFGQPQTFSTGQRQSTITLPASQRQQNTSPVAVEQFSSDAPQGTDYLAMAKKYAPFIIGAIVLYYIISKK